MWEIAEGGTLFLDEITEAPRAIQPKLLRVLQDRIIRRLGSSRLIPIDVQVVAASNRDPKKEIREGRFREDLYHRLSLFHLHLPPLRERREDILPLVAHFAGRYAVHPVQFSQDALNLLTKHSWTGNVRELANLVRAAVTHAADGMIYAADLLPRLQMTGEAENSRNRYDVDAKLKEENRSSPATASLDEQVKKFLIPTEFVVGIKTMKKNG